MKTKEILTIAAIALAVTYALRSVESGQVTLPLIGAVGPKFR